MTDSASLSPGLARPRPKAVALGGGHGLYACLSALRLLDVDITAVVTVADDGGSSGRIRRELEVLPPGDLRMALAALADSEGPWQQLLQHRLGGSGVLAGHPVGNLLLTGLMELHADPVAALDALSGLTHSRGRVLPMSPVPLDLVAEVGSVDPDDRVRARTIRGQSAIAATAGRVQAIRIVPAQPPACAEAVAAIDTADVVFLGPGSWFTSVIPHLLVPGLAAALTHTAGRVVAVLNLESQVGETEGFSAVDHLQVLQSHCPTLRLHAVIVDENAVDDLNSLRRFADGIGARLVVAPVAEASGAARHDAAKLSRAISSAINPASSVTVDQQVLPEIGSAVGKGIRVSHSSAQGSQQGVSEWL